MPHVSVVQRAFELAQSGKFSTAPELRKALRTEGFSHRDLVETTFPSMAKQLRNMLRSTALVE